MRVQRLEGDQPYDGTQLSTTFVDRHAPGEGDVLLLFEGPADVPVEHLVDLEDAEAGAVIASERMAHLIVEHRDLDLAGGVLAQRLLMRLAARWLEQRAGALLDVQGDDLYLHERKLSVSVATRSPRGILIHTALNVTTEGTPVPTAGLRDLRVPAGEFLREVGRLYADEWTSMVHAQGKVRPVP